MAAAALVTKERKFLRSAYHVAVMAFASSFFVALAGIMDWRRFYGGAWLLEIEVKMVLAGLFVVLLLLTLLLGRLQESRPAVMFVFYGLCALNVLGLGFFGGQLVYRGFAPEAPERFRSGRNVFESHCSGCHRRGENIIEPTLPLRSAPQLKNFGDFLAFVRNPRLPDGSIGPMPRFSADRLSDEACRQLYDYLYFAFVTQKRSEGL
ncbi:MAG: c-type cytochrome [Methylococcus sp.]|nr:c-type cytochrome [Methylococcus sp.]